MAKEAVAKTRTRASGKKKKDPNAPKRPMTAYMYFATERREGVRAANPDAKFGDLGKLIGEQWRGLGEAEKKIYEDKAQADKKRYEEEKAVYKKPE